MIITIKVIAGQVGYEIIFMSSIIFAVPPETGELASARKIRRLLSFQRYFRSAHLFRDVSSLNSLCILDDDYGGQALVSLKC